MIWDRSHIVVIKETRPYNRTAFAKKHARVRETSVSSVRKVASSVPLTTPVLSQCTGPASNLARHFRFCGKTYPEVGEFGLDVELEREDGELETGYLPFLGALPEAAGPKVSLLTSAASRDYAHHVALEQDIVRIPIDNCTAKIGPASDSRFSDSQYPEQAGDLALIACIIPDRCDAHRSDLESTVFRRHSWTCQFDDQLHRLHISCIHIE